MRAAVRRGLRRLLEAVVTTEVIGQEACPMMLRWTILAPGDPPWFKILVHHFPPDTTDRDPHDHPRSFVTFVLRGSYFDKRWPKYGHTKVEEVKAGAVRYRPAEYTHIVETGSKGAWTVVVMGPEIREWGFLRLGRWIPFLEYIDRYGGVVRCDDVPSRSRDYKGTPPPA